MAMTDTKCPNGYSVTAVHPCSPTLGDAMPPEAVLNDLKTASSPSQPQLCKWVDIPLYVGPLRMREVTRALPSITRLESQSRFERRPPICLAKAAPKSPQHGLKTALATQERALRGAKLRDARLRIGKESRNEAFERARRSVSRVEDCSEVGGTAQREYQFDRDPHDEGLSVLLDCNLTLVE